MGRSPCCDKQGLKKGPWTQEEDKILVDFIQAHGHGSWRSLPKLAGLVRCGKSCRLRWTNYLRPDIKRGPFTPDEQKSIIQLHGIVGNKWSAIAAQLPGRTDNEIKNHWNTHLKKRLLRMGLNPDTSASATRHMAQWENARLEAEARLSRESLLSRDSLLFSPATSSSQDNINNNDDILTHKLEPDIFLRIWNSEVGDAFRKQSTSSCSVKLEESDVTMSAANVGSRDDVESKCHVAAGESSSTNEEEETYQQYLREFAGDEFSLFHGQLGGFSLFQGELNVDGFRDHD